VDHGTYPFVTSSNTVAGAACAGAGVGPGALHEVVGIAKAYTTRVGAGPFPTEAAPDVADRLRRLGDEFGATTGRPRRCGWFDVALVRRSALLNGLTRLALTKLDVLSHFDEIPLCVAYEGDAFDLDAAVPRWETLPGWRADLSSCRSLADLPQAARRYVARIEELLGVPIELVSVGAGREATLRVGSLLGGAETRYPNGAGR
jgi:adenylosuccinate synthase